MNQMDRLTDETVKNLIRGKSNATSTDAETGLKGKLTRLLEECKKVEDISDIIRNVIEEINPDVVEVVRQPDTVQFIDLTDLINELKNTEEDTIDIADLLDKIENLERQ